MLFNLFRDLRKKIINRFAEIVANSSVLLGGFRLNLSGPFWQSKWKIQEVLNLDRRLQTLIVSNANGSHEAMVDVLKKFGPTLKSLTLSESKVDDFTLREMLKCADSLETLTLIEVTVVKKLPAINPVSLRKVKSLTIHHCDWNIAKFISAQVRSLDIKSYLDEGLKCNLINFFAQQTLMKELSLRGTSSRTLFQQDELIDNCNYSLEKFSIDQDFGKNSDNVNWHITAFLSLHIDTLKKVEINGPHCDHINGFAISNLLNLDSLVLDVRGLPKDEDFYEFLEREPNLKLKNLTLRGFFVQHRAIKKILKKYPEIETLELNDWGHRTVASEMLNFIANNSPRLQKLTISEISHGEEVKFNVLRNLNVTFIRDSSKLIKFVAGNTSIEKLQIGVVYVGQVTTQLIKEINELEHLKHLAFGGNEKALKSIIELMKTKNQQTSLKTLNLSLISDGKSALNPAKALKLFFPIKSAESVNSFA